MPSLVVATHVRSAAGLNLSPGRMSTRSSPDSASGFDVVYPVPSLPLRFTTDVLSAISADAPGSGPHEALHESRAT